MWFLIRVIPKPSRAAYPCQRAAFPFATGFILWLLGGLGMAAFIRKTRRQLRDSKFHTAFLCFITALLFCAIAASIYLPKAIAEYAPSDPPNIPLGKASGIFPGRVVWVHDPDATTWDPVWNNDPVLRYWDDDHTNQTIVNAMLSKAVRKLTEHDTDPEAWDALFRHFNKKLGRGERGYLAGEKIAIKINHVEQRSHRGNSGDTADNGNKADLSPQVCVALLKQLVYEASVPQDCITLTDPSRFIADKTYNRCSALFPLVHYVEDNFSYPGNDCGTLGREKCTYTTDTLLRYSSLDPNGGDPKPIPSDRIPMPFYEADYVINLGVLKGHAQAGVTLSGKNWYGCLGHPPDWAHHNTAWMAGDWHCAGASPESGQYRSMVDMMGHEHLGGKTMLYMLDGLWGFQKHGSSSRPRPWNYEPFNGDYPSSILISQDPVALDSVGLDFLRAEFSDDMGGAAIEGAIDDYMHEAAQAGAAPSGTIYDPEQDGKPLSSLGVHEHWNNEVDKLYSVNINTGSGIELVALSDLQERAFGILEIIPSVEDAFWLLEGPDDIFLEDSGTTTLLSSPTGLYIIRWHELVDYEIPEPSTGTLVLEKNTTAIFQGDYHLLQSGQQGWTFH